MANENGFLLFKPRLPINSHQVAKTLSMCKGIKAVFLTSGEYGFIAVTKKEGAEIQRIRNFVAKKCRFEKVSLLVKHGFYKSGSFRIRGSV